MSEIDWTLRWRLFKSRWFPYRAVTCMTTEDFHQLLDSDGTDIDWEWHAPSRGPFRWWMRHSRPEGDV